MPSMLQLPFPRGLPRPDHKVGQGGLPEAAGMGLGSPVGGGPVAERLAICVRLVSPLCSLGKRFPKPSSG